jgi:hypothetical protein
MLAHVGLKSCQEAYQMTRPKSEKDIVPGPECFEQGVPRGRSPRIESGDPGQSRSACQTIVPEHRRRRNPSRFQAEQEFLHAVGKKPRAFD